MIKPIITEKSLALAAKGWYTFAVDAKSNKPQIAKAINDQYKVSVIDARSMVMHKNGWKKAIVRLKAGQKIDAFETHEQKS